MKAVALAEVPGNYGPITVAESLLQKIWQRGDFLKDKLQTTEGLPLSIIARGTLNHQEGPDFKDAQIEIAGRSYYGDIEIHFYERDWFYHEHHRNPHFQKVVLHVVLFDPKPDAPRYEAKDGCYTPPHTFCLLPLLRQDVESYAIHEAYLAIQYRLSNQDLDPWLALPIERRRQLLRSKARLRWEQKVQFARQRLERLGWQEACHHFFLEVLGYRRNRAPMVDLAALFPLEAMVEERQAPGDYFSFSQERWKLSGLRPANHPLRRIQQYLDLLAQRPQWPDGLRKMPFYHAEPSVDTASFRRSIRLRQQRHSLKTGLLADTLSGSRLDTLICDAFLPLLSALNQQDYFALWFHWLSGDMPEDVHAFAKAIEVINGKDFPSCHGFHQGILQLFIEENRLL